MKTGGRSSKGFLEASLGSKNGRTTLPNPLGVWTSLPVMKALCLSSSTEPSLNCKKEKDEFCEKKDVIYVKPKNLPIWQAPLD